MHISTALGRSRPDPGRRVSREQAGRGFLHEGWMAWVLVPGPRYPGLGTRAVKTGKTAGREQEVRL
jgi:hypothetical protein